MQKKALKRCLFSMLTNEETGDVSILMITNSLHHHRLNLSGRKFCLNSKEKKKYFVKKNTIFIAFCY